MIRTSTCFGAALFLLALAQVAGAHPGHDVGSGFSAGVLHPISGIDHILAMMAVGIWASQVGGRAIVWLPLTFVSLMIGGGLLNLAHVPLPMVEQGIMASVLVLGIMIAIAAKLPVPGMMAIVGAFAIFHGYAHVSEMNAGASPGGYAAGFVLMTALLHAAGIGVGLAMKRKMPRPTLRWAGASIACCGLLMFLHVL